MSNKQRVQLRRHTCASAQFRQSGSFLTTMSTLVDFRLYGLDDYIELFLPHILQMQPRDVFGLPYSLLAAAECICQSDGQIVSFSAASFLCFNQRSSRRAPYTMQTFHCGYCMHCSNKDHREEKIQFFAFVAKFCTTAQRLHSTFTSLGLAVTVCSLKFRYQYFYSYSWHVPTAA